ncbi:hypothetical protein JCM10049v2_007586 [Rhodotorula toruloides]
MDSPISPLQTHGWPSDSNHFPPSPPPHPDPLPSYWLQNFSSVLTHAGMDAELPQEADVVVIGSGLTGTCFVDELVRLLTGDEGGRFEGRTVKVVVLEARTFCSGATGRNGGHLTAYPIAHFADISSAHGIDEARRAIRLEEGAIKWVVETCESEGWSEWVDLRKDAGTLAMFDSPAEIAAIESSLALAAKAGQDTSTVRWVSSAEAREQYGAETKRGLFVPGNTLYPLKFVTGLFRRAQKKAEEAVVKAQREGSEKPVEVDLFTHCLVDKVVEGAAGEGGRGRWVVKTARGDIKATHVVHATNGYASHVLPSLNAPNSLHSRILPTRAQMLALHPTSSSSSPNWTPAFSPSSPPDPPHSSNHPKGVNAYFFQRSYSAAGRERGEILLGGEREKAEGWEWGVADDASVNQVVSGKLKEAMGKLFPSKFGKAMDGTEAVMEWTGIMGYRSEGNPMVGPVYIDGQRQEGQWISAGYSGHGMPRAPLCGHLLASLIHHSLRQTTSTTARPFTLPAWFPRHLLTTIDGKGRGDTRLAEESEAGAKKREKGWVWVRGENGGEKGQTGL